MYNMCVYIYIYNVYKHVYKHIYIYIYQKWCLSAGLEHEAAAAAGRAQNSSNCHKMCLGCLRIA